MANEQRGEVELKLGDATYTLRPTFEALCVIEGRLGAGILELAERMAERRFGLRDATTVIFELAKAGGQDVKEADIGEGILEIGLFSAISPILELLGRILAGPSEGNSSAPSVEPTR